MISIGARDDREETLFKADVFRWNEEEAP